MNNASNYPSCIKIPAANSKQTASNTMVLQKFDLKESSTLNSELISLANRIFGDGKWSHSITSQTIDFVEPFMGKYVCGCATVVKIQLQNETFHEDMGYCHTEGDRKGLSIHYARTGSLTEAFKKTLSCFGNTIEAEIRKVLKQPSNSHTNNVTKDEPQLSFSPGQLDIFELASTHSTPILTHQNEEPLEKASTHQPNDEEVPIQPAMKETKSIEEISKSVVYGVKDTLQSNRTKPQNEPDNANKHSNPKKVSEEEQLRMERKRKQMEKQAEFKRQMKEKEKQQNTGENRKPNPKY